MMIEFTRLINHCDTKYQQIPFCTQCPMSACRKCGSDCYQCLHYIHQKTTTKEHYSCQKITFNYVLKHGHRYTSEIAHAINLIKTDLDYTHPIYVISVGCGPSTELYGLIEALPNISFCYKGIDRQPLWYELQQFNVRNIQSKTRTIQYSNQDFFQFIEEDNRWVDILILNYLFSDMVKYEPQKCCTFADHLVSLIQQGKFRHVIINDVMLLYSTGYAVMEHIASKLKTTSQYSFNVKRFHFQQPNQWQFKYGEKLENNLLTPMMELAVNKYNPFTECGSILMTISTISNNL